MNAYLQFITLFAFSLKSIQDGMTGILFRILQDGSVITRVRRRQWNFLNKGDYCLDGSKNLFHTNRKLSRPTLKEQGDGGAGEEDDDDETIIFYCHKEVATNEATISKLYGASMIISSLFLLVTLIVFGILWEKHRYNIQRWTIFSYVLTLLLMYFFFILSYFSNFLDGEITTNMGMCRFVGIGMHFFFLSTFCWLTTLNFEIWWTVKSFTSQSKYLTGFRRLFAYGIFAFGIPVVILTVGLILEAIYESDVNSEVIIPEYGRFTCNIGSRDAFWAYMYGPVGFLLICDTIFFITTIVQMWKILNNPKTQSSVTPKQRKQSELVSRFGKLYIVMGVPWIFEVISFAAHEDEFRWYWIIFDLINIFQSVAIFIIFVCNQETVIGVQTKYPFLKRYLSPLISKKSTLGNHDGGSGGGGGSGHNNLGEEEDDSGKLSTVDIGTVVPKETIEMT